MQKENIVYYFLSHFLQPTHDVIYNNRQSFFLKNTFITLRIDTNRQLACFNCFPALLVFTVLHVRKLVRFTSSIIK